MISHPARAAARTRLPLAPAVAVAVREVAWVAVTGEVALISPAEAAARLRSGTLVYLCHGPAVARRLDLAPFHALDVLELFAFVRPARFTVPTVRGLASRLLLPVPETLAGEAAALYPVARALLAELTASPGADAGPLAAMLAAAGWPWADAVLSALADPITNGLCNRAFDDRSGGDTFGHRFDALKVWRRLPEWDDAAPPPPADSWPVEPVEARARLVQLLGPGAEPRPDQLRYAAAVTAAFQPPDRVGEPHVVLADAGTGIGKTLAYIAPASLWARKNRGSVWIATYTRNLQRQLDQELDRAYPRRADKLAKVVVRKGRENLFCLLNFEEAVVADASRLGGRDRIALGLIARWAGATRDGDMVGGDFPAWLVDVVGERLTLDLTDSRNECIYAACPHYRRCFIERTIRKARRAEIVVANHALVMVQAARGGDDGGLPTRYVFDEAHHLFDAADSAFSLHLTGRETAELRQWLTGADGSRRPRRRGLKERIADLIAADNDAQEALVTVLGAARLLPGPGWRSRLIGGSPQGPTEEFLHLIRTQVYARSPDRSGGYGLEAALQPPIAGLPAAARALDHALARFILPLTHLAEGLAERLDTEAASLDSGVKARIEGLRRSLLRRAIEPIAGWRAMLRVIEGEPAPMFVDWLGIDRLDGQELDVGLHRHWLDPTRPFAHAVLEGAHGVLLTSATLRAPSECGNGDENGAWAAAEAQTGVRHLKVTPVRVWLPSPFDYARHSQVLVIGDVDRADTAQVAAAYRELFLAAGGGGLGLFTAIARLRAVHALIAGPLESSGIRLLAQHVDGFDLGSLIDIFRDDTDSCLLGTDAVRDGIDVPGRSLRLIVFDRVPWPRPTILHRARREAFGGRAHDERLVCLRLRQAFGRLLRKADDRGVFVVLDRQLPSRLLTALPAGAPIHRLGLADAVQATRAMFTSS